MNELSPSTQGNWYQLGSLLIQFGFLAAVVWFVRNLVKMMRTFQEEMRALLKLSITASSKERPGSEASPYWLTPAAADTGRSIALTESGPGRLTIAWRGLMHWLREPMSPAELIPLRRMIRWLKAPAGS